MRQAGFSHVHHIASTLSDEMEASRSELVNMLAIVDNKLDTATLSTTGSTLTDDSSHQEEKGNAVISTKDNKNMFDLIEKKCIRKSCV